MLYSQCWKQKSVYNLYTLFKMRSKFPQQFLFLSLLIDCCIIHVSPVFSQCLNNQKILLLELKNSLVFDQSFSRKLVQWNQTRDCCTWAGVKCNAFGHVISLQLDGEAISGGVENSGSLFKLDYLEKLNLAVNSVSNIQIPKGLSKLRRLTDLNLSNAGFGGQIPDEILRMKSLVSLDFSSQFSGIQPLKLENPDLRMLVQNLTGLKELLLDSVNISTHVRDWSQVISSHLPDLRTLSLQRCYLSGPIDFSLSNLKSLSVLNLDGNNLSSPVPKFFANFSSLTTLTLSYCSLVGSFPEEIFHVPTLENLDVWYNPMLGGSIPHFFQNQPLRTVKISKTNFTGSLPDSIGNLGFLSRLELSNCSLTGLIPKTVANLSELTFLDISRNNFTGSLPMFRFCKKLVFIDASRNSLTGSLSSLHFKGLVNLTYIDLGFNFLTGNIPPLLALPSLQQLYLLNNHFHCQIQELENPSSSVLKTLDLSSNRLEGPIPKFFSKLEHLSVLSLSSNGFNGTVDLENFRNYNLSRLELSYNNLSIYAKRTNSTSFFLPGIHTLKLASCKLQKFPEISRQVKLYELDLSSNYLSGKIPNWIWEIGNGSLENLNLSFNVFHGFQEPYEFPPLLTILDLHSNHFKGELPLLSSRPNYVDYSSNFFSGSIPDDIGNSISGVFFFSASNNNLTGEIPTSICNAYYLKVLDLSNNALSGSIPPCLASNPSLGVLSLGSNNVSGEIPDTFTVKCSLKTLDLNNNAFQGKIPVSLVNCSSLEVLNFGNNRLKDKFPCMLINTTTLRVLVLRSNKLYGKIGCPKSIWGWQSLQIIDISANEFGGEMSMLSSLTGMIHYSNDRKSHYDHLRFDFTEFNNYHYQDSVTVNMNGLEMELTKILIVFTSIDFSRNNFRGKIPNNVGDLKLLYLLNLSHNALTGEIPGSIGGLRQLVSLDLSANSLTGNIPAELSKLTFLSFLDLSSNALFGMIPKGSQFQTFSAGSYEGNAGLCGFPVNMSCSSEEIEDSGSANKSREIEFEWGFVSAALGYAVGFAGSVWLLVICTRWEEL